MIGALLDGLRAVRRSFGLVVLVLASNLAFALLLAVPLAASIEKDVDQRDAAHNLMYGFDYPWWSRFSDAQTGPAAAFRPEIFGTGFAFQNLDLLLRGQLPVQLFARGEPNGLSLDPLTLGVGLGYLLLQTFLLGGILGVFRSGEGRWTVRGLLHGSGFYFGRLFRVMLTALACAWVVFALNAPLARWADGRALEAVSESTAMAWTLGRHALLLLALLAVALLSSYAKAYVVVEERSSAILAFASALGFCLRNPGKTIGHAAAILALGLLALALFGRLDAALEVTGYKTQLLALALMQALLLVRIGLRLAFVAGQVSLLQRAQA